MTLTIPFGNYQPTWPERGILRKDLPSQIVIQNLKAIFQLSFEASSGLGFGALTDDIISTTINTSTIEDALVLLHEYFGIRFPSCDSTIHYILQHQNLFDTILYACISTQEYFGERAQISLELYRDPEIKDEYLTIYVRQSAYESDLIDQIDRLSEKLEEKLADENSWFLITTDFHPPLE